MIRRGLRIEDDSDTQVKEQRITLDPNRKKDAFEKDMDDFLFGGPAVKRRESVKKVELKQKTQQNSAVKQQLSIISKIQQASFEVIQKTDSVILNLSSIIKATIQTSVNSSQVQSRANSRTKSINPDKPPSEAGSLKGSMILKQGDSTITNNNNQKPSSIEPKVNGQRKMSEMFREVQTTRPNYIRKLKIVSEIDSFAEENAKQHKFIDVVRPFECSRNYIAKYQSQNFRDNQFPPSKASLGIQLQQPQVEWKRFPQTVKHPTLGKYIDPNDIKKGKFSSQKFLSTLSVLAEREQNIKRLIEDQIFSPQQGVYCVRLFINSVWRYVAVDTFLPVCDGNNGSATSYNDTESDIWVSLIQKAYAKVFNGYDVFITSQPIQYYLRDLTGAPISNYKMQHLFLYLRDNPDILSIVKKAIENKKVVGAVMKSSVSDLGLNPNCILTVLGVNKKGGFILRYSWPLIQQKASIQISRQGIFDLNQTQLNQHLSYITISNISRNYFNTTIQTRHEPHFYVCYKIQLEQQTHGYFTLTQMDERMFPRETYNYQPARLFIQKKTSDSKWKYAAGGFSHMERNLDVEVNLEKGEYFVFAFVSWGQNVYDFGLTFYGSKPVEFVKVPTLKDHNIISYGLQSQNLLSGKRSALGHVHQYISYHQQTNQILITVVNTSSKPYNYIQDLSKINFQLLFLMNLTNNQKDILQGMTKQELVKYKNQALENRKWEIELAPQENFTWVISTNENYDTGNYKAWGFR